MNRIIGTTVVLSGTYFAAKAGLFNTKSVIIDRDHQCAKMMSRNILPNQVEVTPLSRRSRRVPYPFFFPYRS